MKLYDYINELACVIPLELQEEWDNSGIQLNTGNMEISKVLVALELTSDVVKEAIEGEFDLIVTHHPLFFNGLKKVDSEEAAGNWLISLIKAGISVYSCHTNFDKCHGGNNDYLASIMELDERSTMADEEFTRMGYCNEMTLREAAIMLADGLDVPVETFNIVGDIDADIEVIGMCSGAGSEFMDLAAALGCDLYITGDLKHHEARHAEEIGINVIDAGHYGTEKIFADAFIDIMLNTGFTAEIDFVKSNACRSPFCKL